VKLNQITWARWRVIDPYNDKYYNVFTVSIPQPSYQYPCAAVLLSIASGKNKVLLRFGSLDELREIFITPDDYRERLELGYRMAIEQRDKIQRHLKTFIALETAKGAVVDTGTGEILAEAERIVNGKQRQ